MFKSLSNTQKAILLALAGYTAFAVSDICAKWLAQSYSVTQVVTTDSAIAAALMLLAAPLLGGMADLRKKENLPLHGLRAVLNAGINILMVTSLTLMPIAAVYTMVFTKPFIAALLAIPLYGQKVTKSRWLAIAAGFCGVLISLKPGTAGLDYKLLLPLAGAFVVALMFVTSRSLKEPSNFTLGFIPLAGSAILTLPLMIMSYTPFALADLPIFMLGGLALGFAITCISLAFRLGAAATVSPFMYSQMISGIVFGYLIFGDAPDGWMLAGAAVIIASGIFLMEAERRIANKPRIP